MFLNNREFNNRRSPSRETSKAPSEIYIRVDRGDSVYRSPTPELHNVYGSGYQNPQQGMLNRVNFQNAINLPPPPPPPSKKNSNSLSNQYTRYSDPSPRRGRGRGREDFPPLPRGGGGRGGRRWSPPPPTYRHPPRRRRTRRNRSMSPRRRRRRSRSPRRDGRYTGHKRKREYETWNEENRWRREKRDRNDMFNRNVKYMKHRDLVELIAKEGFQQKLIVEPIYQPKIHVTSVTIEIKENEYSMRDEECDDDEGYDGTAERKRTFTGRDSKKSYAQQLAAKDALEFIKTRLEDMVSDVANDLLENEDENAVEELKSFTSVTSQVNELVNNVTSQFDALQRVQRVCQNLFPFNITLDRSMETGLWEVTVKCEDIVVKSRNQKKIIAEEDSLKLMMTEFKRYPQIVNRYNLNERKD